MIELLTQDQKDRLFRKLIVSASDILSEELGIPKRSFEEIEQLVRGNDSEASQESE